MSARERVFTVCQSLASRNDRFMIDSPDVATNDINGHHSNDHQPETRRPLFWPPKSESVAVQIHKIPLNPSHFSLHGLANWYNGKLVRRGTDGQKR